MEKSAVPVANSYHHLVIVYPKEIKVKTYASGGGGPSITWTPDNEHIIYGEQQLNILRIDDGKRIGRLIGARTTHCMITTSGRFLYWKDVDDDIFFVIKNPFLSQLLYINHESFNPDNFVR
jgi:hypothetical protein